MAPTSGKSLKPRFGIYISDIDSIYQVTSHALEEGSWSRLIISRSTGAIIVYNGTGSFPLAKPHGNAKFSTKPYLKQTSKEKGDLEEISSKLTWRAGIDELRTTTSSVAPTRNQYNRSRAKSNPPTTVLFLLLLS